MATEQETDYEAGDPSRQQTGFDDMSDDEEEEGHEHLLQTFLNSNDSNRRTNCCMR